MLRVAENCPICETHDRTLVCEYNRFILLHGNAEAAEARYDYQLCHGCGLVYASQRPTGAEFQSLLQNFNESLGRPSRDELILIPTPLTEKEKAKIVRLAGRGIFVSEEDAQHGEWMKSLLSDRLYIGPHLELLSSLVPLHKKRVLEVRSRTGALLVSLRRLFESDVYAMAIFESQQFVNKQVYGIPADTLIDFEHFTIPYEGTFDLIICKHMFTHALNPPEFFSYLRSRLSPDGYLYLYAEPDDARAIRVGKSIFHTLNPFHMQQFDTKILGRCLRRSGFDPVFITHIDEELACLARPSNEVVYNPITPDELDGRRTAYRQWRDVSILMLPEELQPVFAPELEDVRRRAIGDGLAFLDRRERIRIVPAKLRKTPQATTTPAE